VVSSQAMVSNASSDVLTSHGGLAPNQIRNLEERTQQKWNEILLKFWDMHPEAKHLLATVQLSQQVVANICSIYQ